MDALNTGRDISRVIKNYRRDGTAFWNEVTISAVRHPATGKVTHFLGTQTDVTDHAGTGKDPQVLGQHTGCGRRARPTPAPARVR